jgi:DNA-directed RNA polymerase specialized sigma24 family protein
MPQLSRNDQELVFRCLAGEDEAWETLARQIRQLACSLHTAGQLDATLDVDDLVQEALAVSLAENCRLLRAYDSDRARISTYLAVVVRRLAIQSYRKCARELTWGQVYGDGEPTVSVSDHTDSITIWDAIRRALNPLDALILRYTAIGYNSEEIADLLGQAQGRPFTVEAIRQRRSRAYRRLRSLLSPR